MGASQSTVDEVKDNLPEFNGATGNLEVRKRRLLRRLLDLDIANLNGIPRDVGCNHATETARRVTEFKPHSDAAFLRHGIEFHCRSLEISYARILFSLSCGGLGEFFVEGLVCMRRRRFF